MKLTADKRRLLRDYLFGDGDWDKLGEDLQMKLTSEYADEIPIGTQMGDTGLPEEWFEDHIEALQWAFSHLEAECREDEFNNGPLGVGA